MPLIRFNESRISFPSLTAILARQAKPRTFELLIQPSTRRDGQRAYELLKVDCAVLVLVEDLEYVVGELGGVAEGEELLVDLGELLFVELTGGAVLEEAFVPEYMRCEMEAGDK